MDKDDVDKLKYLADSMITNNYNICLDNGVITIKNSSGDPLTDADLEFFKLLTPYNIVKLIDDIQVYRFMSGYQGSTEWV